MEGALQDFTDRTLSAETSEEIGALLQASVALEGFSAFAFGRYQHGIMTSFIWDTLPDQFSHTYAEQRWDRIDPLLQKAQGTTRAFVWSTAVVDPALSPHQQDFIHELRGRRVGQAVMTPLHGPGGKLDLCGLISEEHEAASAARLRRVHGFVLQAWLRHGDLAATDEIVTPELSNRELECLQWLRASKTNWQISQILQISEKTVEFHVGNLLRKLEAESRLAAVLIAIRRGMLEL